MKQNQYRRAVRLQYDMQLTMYITYISHQCTVGHHAYLLVQGCKLQALHSLGMILSPALVKSKAGEETNWATVLSQNLMKHQMPKLHRGHSHLGFLSVQGEKEPSGALALTAGEERRNSGLILSVRSVRDP